MLMSKQFQSRKTKAQEDDRSISSTANVSSFQGEVDICRSLSHMAALHSKKQRSFQAVIAYIWWQKRPLGLRLRPHRKLRASAQGKGEKEGGMEVKPLR